MASSVVADLEAMLTAMAAGKPPGVSGSKINSITSLCVTNVQSESVLIQKMYTHFKKTPNTHKLGVLYAIDSVARKWLEVAKTQGQIIDSAAPDGTYAAGVNKVIGLMPGLMNDMTTTTSSQDQNMKEKIRKLVDIWERVQLFSADMISEFRDKLSSAPSNQYSSTTPPGSPPRNSGLPGIPQKSPNSKLTAQTNNRPHQDITSVLNALAKVAQQAPAPSAAPPVAPPAASTTPPTSQPPSLSQILGQLGAVRPQNGQVGPNGHNSQNGHNGHTGYGQTNQPPPLPQNMNHPPPPPPILAANPATIAPHAGAMAGGGNPYVPQPAAAAPTLSTGYMNPPAPPQVPGLPQNLDPNMQQQVLIIKTLIEQGVPQDKIPTILASLAGTGAVPPPAVPAQPPAPQFGGAPGGYPGQYESLDRNRDHSEHDRGRPDPSQPLQRGRSRSRSPGRSWAIQGGRFSPRGREASIRVGDFGVGLWSPQKRRHDDDRRDYRQRSPHRRARSPSPGGNAGLATVIGPAGMLIPAPDQVSKLVDQDPALPPGHIKVYSRTLFVGGVACSESELSKVFSRYGWVQSCIVNHDKRHAFVKMVTREHAESAKKALSDPNSRDGLAVAGVPFRQCRWGVGYGPRDSSDYSSGISVIPINRLTEADRRWMLTAEYGGSGGKDIQQGLVVEEPDIEIGAGVSSKAISKRVGGEKTGAHGSHQKKGNKFDRKIGKYDDDSRGGWGHSSKDRDGYHRRGSGSRDTGNPNNMPVADRRTGRNYGNDDGQPEVEDLPFGLEIGPNGMPKFPPGFRFPDPHPK